MSAAELLAATRRLAAPGMNLGTAGNLSVREGEGMLITPSAVPYDQLEEHMLVYLDPAGNQRGSFAPSSEWRFHEAIYQAQEQARAVVHTHSTFATTLACMGLDIPPFHYEVAHAGGYDIRCSPYATYGTQKLADYMLEALEGRKACLLGNHGLISWGQSLDEAVSLAEKVEHLAEMYCHSLKMNEPVVLLSRQEMATVAEKFSRYGQ